MHLTHDFVTELILEIVIYRSQDNNLGASREKRSLERRSSKTPGIDQSPAMGSRTDPDALIVERRQRKTKLVVLDFQKLRGHRYALTDLSGRHMPHVYVNPHRLFVFDQVGRYQKHARIFHEANHRWR